MNITYENKGDYYIFSHEPNTRVYLGNAAPEDYIHDEENQAKRSIYLRYVNKETGESKRWEEFDHDAKCDFDFHNKYEFKCDYDFNRKLVMTSMGSSTRNVKYISSDKVAKRLAWTYVFNQTLEEYDSFEKKWQETRLEWKRKNPLLYNLRCFDGETYYVNDNGDRITFEEHVKLMKEELGEDCFELAAKGSI